MGGQLGIDLGTTWAVAAIHRAGRVEIARSAIGPRRFPLSSSCGKTAWCSRATRLDISGLAQGDYTLVFTSDNADDNVDGQPPSTTQVVSPA
jgi:hypothetical protein